VGDKGAVSKEGDSLGFRAHWGTRRRPRSSPAGCRKQVTRARAREWFAPTASISATPPTLLLLCLLADLILANPARLIVPRCVANRHAVAQPESRGSRAKRGGRPVGAGGPSRLGSRFGRAGDRNRGGALAGRRRSARSRRRLSARKRGAAPETKAIADPKNSQSVSPPFDRVRARLPATSRSSTFRRSTSSARAAVSYSSRPSVRSRSATSRRSHGRSRLASGMLRVWSCFSARRSRTMSPSMSSSPSRWQ
jgi:hypothetical protein